MARLLLPLLAVVLLAGCKDECVAADFPPRCDGNVLVTCPIPGVDQMVPVRILHTDCGARLCTPSGGSASCTLSSSPSPACDGGMRAACEGPTGEVQCWQGFATDRKDCRACVVTDAGSDCQGGLSAVCQAEADCLAGLTCWDGGYGTAWCQKQK